MLDERQMVEAAAQGDVRAFETLVHAHQRAVVASAWHLLHNHDDAEDLAQETFVEAYRSLHSLRDSNKFRAWLFTILHHKCLRHLKRLRPQEVALDEVADTLPTPTLPIGDLSDLLAQLPLGYREVMAARYLHEMSYAEIATLLGITEHAVRMRCTRARAQLRSLVQQEQQETHALWQAMMAIPFTQAFTERVMQEVSTMTHVYAQQQHAFPELGGHRFFHLATWKLVAGITLVLTLSGSAFFFFRPGGHLPIEAAGSTALVTSADERQPLKLATMRLNGKEYTPGPVIKPTGLALPIGIAVDNAGNLYVTDVVGNRVAKYAPNGKLITQWGAQVNAAGQFTSLSGITLGPDGHLYILDGNRVQIFSADGKYLRQWSTQTTANLTTPVLIAFGPDKLIYIVGGEQYKPGTKMAVQVFQSNGTPLRSWEIALTNKPTMGMAIDTLGNIFIAVYGYGIRKYTPTGKLLQEWQDYYASGIAIDSTGNVYLGKTYGNEVHAIRELSSAMQILPLTIPMLGNARSLVFGRNGTLYAVNEQEKSIYTFTPKP